MSEGVFKSVGPPDCLFVRDLMVYTLDPGGPMDLGLLRVSMNGYLSLESSGVIKD